MAALTRDAATPTTPPRRRFLPPLLLLLFLLPLAALSSPFYDLHVLAKAGDPAPGTGYTFKSFKPNPSINHHCKVAFIGILQNGSGSVMGEGVFVGGGTAGGLEYVSTGDALAANKTIGSVWINDHGDVALQYRVSAANSPSGVRRYSKVGGLWTGETIAKGSSARQVIIIDPCLGRITPPFSCPQVYYRRVEAFDSIRPDISLNDSGFAAFVGGLTFDSGQTFYYLTRQDHYLTTKDASQVLPQQVFSFLPDFKPVLANSGHVVARVGNNDNSPILLYGPNLTAPQAIAGASTFQRIGHVPGVSGDGRVVAFFGDLPDPVRAKAFTAANRGVVPLPVTPGRGIFASIEINGIRHMVRVAGEVGSGHLDPGERRPVGTRGDRGQDFDFNDRYSSASDWEITAFVPDEPVAVSSPTPFAVPSNGSYVTVFYTGTNSVGPTQRRAIFSSRINLFNNAAGTAVESVGVEAPMVVAQQDDLLLAHIGQLRSLGGVARSAASDATAFHAESTQGEAMVLATATSVDALRNPRQPRFDPDSPLVECVVAAEGNPSVQNGRTYQPRDAGEEIRQIILHATAGNERGDIRTLGTLAAGTSVHYLVSREGRVTQIVKESFQAFHAGVSNPRTIGIELTDDGDHRTQSGWLTPIQLTKAAQLVRDIASRNEILGSVGGFSVVQHLVPDPALIWPATPNIASVGLRPRPGPSFSVPSVVEGPFERIATYSEGTARSGTDPAFPGVQIPLPFADGTRNDAVGVIRHGQVWNRTVEARNPANPRFDGKDDPRLLSWTAFMAAVNAGLAVVLNSPANLLVTDPQGRRTGYDAGSGQTLLEIPGSQFTGAGTEPQSLSIPDATNGNYTIQVVGTSNGVYRLDVYASGQDAGLTQSQIAGTTTPGQTATYTLHHDAVSGDATTITGSGNLPPVAFPDFATTVSNAPVAIAVLANDNDPEGFLNTNSVTMVTNPAAGLVSVNPTNGVITYTPVPGFPGTNTFAYTVQDNQGALSALGVVTVIVTEPVLTTNRPPIAVNDFASTTNGVPVTIDVLANDSAPDGTLDPSTVTLTRAPTNGTATVDAYTGAITYTPSAGFTGTNACLYTVRDDLGSTSTPATVRVAVFGFGPEPLTAPAYWPVQITAGPADHRYPRINNLGEVLYQAMYQGLWQVFSSTRGQLSYSDSTYSDAINPSLDDAGNFACYRHNNNSLIHETITIYSTNILAGPISAINGKRARPGWPDFQIYLGTHLSLASDGGLAFASTDAPGGWDPGPSRAHLYASRLGLVLYEEGGSFDFPVDANAGLQFVYERGGIYYTNQYLTSGSFPRINDVPTDKSDIVFSRNGDLMSTILGRLGRGATIDINRDGVITYDVLTNGNYQVFKAWPEEPRIISTPGTNAVVGLPYRYTSDNTAYAYGGASGDDDPRWVTPIEWAVVSGPAGFQIDPVTGKITWVPTAPGNYTITLSAVFYLLGTFDFYEHTQTFTVNVLGSTIQTIEATSFLPYGSPDLPANATPYLVGGTNRIGVVADGASRLVLRTEFKGLDLNDPSVSLHFVVAGTNAPGRDGRLRAVNATSWGQDVPVQPVAFGSTNKLVCLYEAPLDYESASWPVTVQLRNGTNILATRAIQLRPPPVVLVHDGWSGPGVWPVVVDQLLNAGRDVFLADYASTSGTNLAQNTPLLFLTVSDALAQVRASGFAASRVDLVGHGSGGLMARLYAQQFAAQDENYRLGSVHKLITLGTPHGGSYLAGALTALKTNSPTAYAIVRSALLSAGDARGQYPACDLNEGFLTGLAPGSPVLSGLLASAVPGHAIATTTASLVPDDPFSLLHYLLGLPVLGDGLSETNSARAGCTNAAATLIAGWPHAYQPFSTNLAAVVEGLLREPTEGSPRFAAFPAPASLAGSNNVPIAGTNTGSWLVLTGATNGQSVASGQTITLAASATDGRGLQSVYFYTPAGASVLSLAPFTNQFQVPLAAIGPQRILVAARDANGQFATVTLTLNAQPAATLQSLTATPSPLAFVTKTPQRLLVTGLYSDSVTRDLTSSATGTRYRSTDSFNVRVDTNGVVRVLAQPAGTVTIGITNGIVTTNVQVAVNFRNLPPTAYGTATRLTGPAPLDIQFDGILSRDPEGQAVSFYWDFGDGTFSTSATPLSHRFLAPGAHTVTLSVEDPLGLVGRHTFPVTVEPRFVMIYSNLVITERLEYDEVIVTNGGVVVAPAGLICGDVTLVASSLRLGTNSTIANGAMTNSSLVATNGLTTSGTVLMDGTNYIVGNVGLGALTAGGTNTLNGNLSLISLNIPSNSVLTTLPQVPLDLTVTGEVRVAAGGRIDASSRGYPGGGVGAPGGGTSGRGPGASVNSNGPGHGGRGGYWPGSPQYAGGCYGRYDDPSDFGSSGYGYGDETGGRGGGVVRLVASALLLDGALLADGESKWGNGNTTAGAGGSVRVGVEVLRGNGTISANGGDHASRPAGGGGRVAVYSTDWQGFGGTILARGGVGHDTTGLVTAERCGGAGTIYLRTPGEAYGELIIDNGGTQTEGWSTPLVTTGPVTLTRLSLKGYVRVQWTNALNVLEQVVAAGTNQLALAAGSVLQGVNLSSNNVSLVITGNVSFPQPLVVNGSNVLLTVAGNGSYADVGVSSNAMLTLSGTNRMNSLLVGTNGALTTLPMVPLDLTVTGEVRVAAGGRIDASSRGYPGGGVGAPGGGTSGRGPGASVNSNGPGHGGRGGYWPGSPQYAGGCYGRYDDPSDFGSSGYGYGDETGGRGGGVVRLVASALLLDGALLADGESKWGNGNTTAGAGGSVRVGVEVLRGNGTISANGGDHASRPAGGGGRVAVYSTDWQGFGGTILARGGVGHDTTGLVTAERCGGAGTIYLKTPGEAYGELIIDNGGTQTEGWSTPLVTTGPVTLTRLSLKGYVRVQWTNALNVLEQVVAAGTNQLALAAGSVLQGVNLSSNNVSLVITGNVSFPQPLVVNGSNVLLTVAGNGSYGDLVVSNRAALTLGGTNRMSSLLVGSNGVLTTLALVPLDLTVTGEVRVAAGGLVDARAKGYQDPVGASYSWGDGPGYGQWNCGASYGGLGGLRAAGTPRYYGWVYETPFDPQQGGSAGRANGPVFAHGGGLIRLAAQRLVMEGVVRADALELTGQSGVGAGSGGGIRLDVGVLEGAGVISADGGGHRAGGGGVTVAGGGGGRIAIYYGARSAFAGQVSAKGGVGRDLSGAVGALQSGGAGTVFWKQTSAPDGELVVDNGGQDTVGWSTPINLPNRPSFLAWPILGNARISTTNLVRVLNGVPADFQSLIASNRLQVGGLIVSNTWVYGDFVLLEMDRFQGQPLVRLIGRPDRSFVLWSSPDIQTWSPAASNSPTSSVWEYLVPDAAPSEGHFYRGQQIPRLP